MTRRSRAFKSTLPPAHRGTGDHKPSPAQLIEARHAQEAALTQPLRYAFGEPLPGRSALDKMKKERHEELLRTSHERCEAHATATLTKMKKGKAR